MADHKPGRSKEIILNIIKRIWKPFTWIVSLALVGYVLAITPFASIANTLSRLRIYQILLLVLLNLGIIFLFGVRWWWILSVQGYRLPFIAIVRYRLAAFGVSYFTPGPQFGGEPLQVYYLKQNHDIPITDALATLSLDKLLELLANFTFLTIGVSVIINAGNLDIASNRAILLIVLILAALPWGYLLILYLDIHPFSKLSLKISAAWPQTHNIHTTLTKVEVQVASFCQSNTPAMIGLMFVSALVWLALVFEYWIALNFLGAQLSVENTMVFITAARLAFLAPLPGGIGSLEISQVMAAQALGMGNEIGTSIGLIIRLRDISFGLLGLLWGGILIRRF